MLRSGMPQHLHRRLEQHWRNLPVMQELFGE